MRARIFIAAAALFILCAPFPAQAEDKLFGFEASIGYEQNDNVVYSPITTKEGEDLLSSTRFTAHVSPKILENLFAKVSGTLDFATYRNMPQYNTGGSNGELSLMYNPFGLNYLYLILNSSTYDIGKETNYFDKSTSLQYIFDVSGRSYYWTTIYVNRGDASYSSSSYEALSNGTVGVGIKQNVTDWLYLLFESTLLKARADDLSFSQNKGELGIDLINPALADISLYVSYNEKNYLEASDVYTETRRKDAEVASGVSVEKEVFPKTFLRVNYGYTNNRCNLDVDEARLGYASFIQQYLGATMTFKI